VRGSLLLGRVDTVGSVGGALSFRVFDGVDGGPTLGVRARASAQGGVRRLLAAIAAQPGLAAEADARDRTPREPKRRRPNAAQTPAL
jgi:hypothetical protein